MSPEQDTRLHHWQAEVARDPGSSAFVPLADLYRAQGRIDVARRVCLRGLSRHPEHVEGHYLLGRISLAAGDPEGAYDEWDITLRLDPSHVGARRSIAFLCLEGGSLEEAERHLRQALENDPHDPRVRRAMDTLKRGSPLVPPDRAFWDAAGRLLGAPIDTFVLETRVRLALVADTSGRIILQRGFSKDLELASFASLAAGINAAGTELARMLGESSFEQLYQGRAEHQIFLGTLPTPHGPLLLLATFGAETTIGLVRALHEELVASVRGLVWPAATRTVAPESLDSGLAAGLDRALAGRGEPVGGSA